MGCRTIAETVVVPLVVDGFIPPVTNALIPLAVFDGGRFFLGDGWISVRIPGRVGCVSSSSSLSFAFEIVTSSSELLFIVGRLWSYLDLDWTVVVVVGTRYWSVENFFVLSYIGVEGFFRWCSSSNVTNLLPVERIDVILRRTSSLSLDNLSNVRLSSERIRSNSGKS